MGRTSSLVAVASLCSCTIPFECSASKFLQDAMRSTLKQTNVASICHAHKGCGTRRALPSSAHDSEWFRLRVVATDYLRMLALDNAKNR